MNGDTDTPTTGRDLEWVVRQGFACACWQRFIRQRGIATLRCSPATPTASAYRSSVPTCIGGHGTVA